MKALYFVEHNNLLLQTPSQNGPPLFFFYLHYCCSFKSTAIYPEVLSEFPIFMFIGHFLAIRRKSINIKKGGAGGERGGGFIMTSHLLSSDLEGK